MGGGGDGEEGRVGRWMKGGEGVHDYSIQYVLFEIVTPSLGCVCSECRSPRSDPVPHHQLVT